MHPSLAIELIPAPRPVEGLPAQIAQFRGMPGSLESLRRRCFEQRPEGLGEMEDPIRHLRESTRQSAHDDPLHVLQHPRSPGSIVDQAMVEQIALG